MSERILRVECCACRADLHTDTPCQFSEAAGVYLSDKPCDKCAEEAAVKRAIHALRECFPFPWRVNCERVPGERREFCATADYGNADRLEIVSLTFFARDPEEAANKGVALFRESIAPAMDAERAVSDALREALQSVVREAKSELALLDGDIPVGRYSLRMAIADAEHALAASRGAK